MSPACCYPMQPHPALDLLSSLFSQAPTHRRTPGPASFTWACALGRAAPLPSRVVQDHLPRPAQMPLPLGCSQCSRSAHHPSSSHALLRSLVAWLVICVSDFTPWAGLLKVGQPGLWAQTAWVPPQPFSSQGLGTVAHLTGPGSSSTKWAETTPLGVPTCMAPTARSAASPTGFVNMLGT